MSTASEYLLGDEIWSLASGVTAEIYRSEFMTSLRNRVLSAERYAGLISGMYPVVVGFNKALIRSLSKIDHVRDTWLVKVLAEQLKEEQVHNDMWRAMLDAFEIDHLSLWSDFCDYINSVDRPHLDHATNAVAAGLVESPDRFFPNSFQHCRFPEPACALFHHMCALADAPGQGFWTHFASQSAIEATIYGVVSDSIYPGVVGNEELDRGPRSTVWWKEHARGPQDTDEPSAEEKHLRIARSNLNRLRLDLDEGKAIFREVKKSLVLFSAAIRCHNSDSGGRWNARQFMRA